MAETNQRNEAEFALVGIDTHQTGFKLVDSNRHPDGPGEPAQGIEHRLLERSRARRHVGFAALVP